MKAFSDFARVSEGSENIDEGTLRNLGAAALFARITVISKKIKRTKDMSDKLDLIASQNTYLAALGLAVGDFFRRRKL